MVNVETDMVVAAAECERLIVHLFNPFTVLEDIGPDLPIDIGRVHSMVALKDLISFLVPNPERCRVAWSCGLGCRAKSADQDGAEDRRWIETHWALELDGMLSRDGCGGVEEMLDVIE
jgi:hypothetical protein